LASPISSRPIRAWIINCRFPSSGRARGVRLRATIAECRPKFLAFTSKAAGQNFLGGKRDYGEQIEEIVDTKIWILPSTSGAANGSWRPEIWHRFADRVRL
jgi:double-stranded uracil-DNA glycosylase